MALLGSVILLGGACTSDTDLEGTEPVEAPSSTSSTAPSERALIETLPEVCKGFGKPRSEGQVSFVVGGHLYLAGADGSSLRCAGNFSPADSMTWNGTARRLLVEKADGVVLVEPDGSRAHVAGPSALADFSLPSGRSMISVSPNHEVLWKTPLDRLFEVEPITFLTYTDAAAYHPAGTQIAVAGLSPQDARGPFAGTYGIFLSDNVGNDPILTAHGESFRGAYDPSSPHISELAWSRRGDTLYFAADHGRRHHLHAVRFRTLDGRFIADSVGSITGGPEPLGHLEVSPFAGRRRLAFARGSCESGFTTSVVLKRSDPHPLHEVPGSVVPVGWLPDGRLVVAASEEPCADTSNLYVWSEHDELEFLVADVEPAAIRAPLPEPPDPPAPVGDQVVA